MKIKLFSLDLSYIKIYFLYNLGSSNMQSRTLISTILTDINDYTNINLSQFYNLDQTHLNLLYFCYLF